MQLAPGLKYAQKLAISQAVEPERCPLPMATCRRAVGRSARFLPSSGLTAQLAARKSSTAFRCSPIAAPPYHGLLPIIPCRQTRSFVSSIRRPITGQEAPSAQAYISSGVLGGNKNLVDVKKVIVIGSGGLSIGQAGEFDYSGMSYL